MAANRYVVLDRDGVINQDSDDFIKSPEEWLPIPQSLEAIGLLNQAGFEVVVITNQSGIARGYFDEAVLAQIHAKMHQQLAVHHAKVSAIYYCPHGSDSLCECRKPKAGLFKQFALDYHVDLSDIPAIGDSLRDIQAAQTVGAQPILVKTGKGRATLAALPHLTFPVFDDLYGAANYLCKQ
jgi:D-glycero-D-manno-heptose 1,7-bisphosphate phosphatase